MSPPRAMSSPKKNMTPENNVSPRELRLPPRKRSTQRNMSPLRIMSPPEKNVCSEKSVSPEEYVYVGKCVFQEKYASPKKNISPEKYVSPESYLSPEKIDSTEKSENFTILDAASKIPAQVEGEGCINIWELEHLYSSLHEIWAIRQEFWAIIFKCGRSKVGWRYYIKLYTILCIKCVFSFMCLGYKIHFKNWTILKIGRMRKNIFMLFCVYF